MRPTIRALALLGVTLSLFACSRPEPPPSVGFVQVEGGRIWYRIVGDGPGTPLLLLHGGPGFPSDYLAPLEKLADQRPVIFYDQLGSGRADRPSDTSLWQLDRFVGEVHRLRAALGLEEVHILGHSWGSMLAAEYMLTDPKGVRSLVLASPALSVTRWIQDTRRLMRTLPEPMQAAISKHEAEGSFDAPEYRQAMSEFMKRFLCRKNPWPADLLKSAEGMSDEVYETMWGPSEFTVTGSLRTFERAEALKSLKLPVLLTTGRFDEATPETTEYYRSLIPGAKLEIFEDSAHMSMLEEPEAYVEAIREFLREAEQR